MTLLELRGKMDQDASARSRNAEAIIAFVRPLVAALKDLGREHTARELEQLLFIYDAHKQETETWLNSHAEEICAAMI